MLFFHRQVLPGVFLRSITPFVGFRRGLHLASQTTEFVDTLKEELL
jgi:hypothetical protein